MDDATLYIPCGERLPEPEPARSVPRRAIRLAAARAFHKPMPCSVRVSRRRICVMLVLPILILLVAVVPSRVQQPPVAENPCSAEPSFCGTAIAFQSSLTATFQGARQTGKLVFLLHVSGHFEDSRFT